MRHEDENEHDTAARLAALRAPSWTGSRAVPSAGPPRASPPPIHQLARRKQRHGRPRRVELACGRLSLRACCSAVQRRRRLPRPRRRGAAHWRTRPPACQYLVACAELPPPAGLLRPCCPCWKRLPRRCWNGRAAPSRASSARAVPVARRALRSALRCCSAGASARFAPAAAAEPAGSAAPAAVVQVGALEAGERLESGCGGAEPECPPAAVAAPARRGRVAPPGRRGPAAPRSRPFPQPARRVVGSVAPRRWRPAAARAWPWHPVPR